MKHTCIVCGEAVDGDDDGTGRIPAGRSNRVTFKGQQLLVWSHRECLEPPARGGDENDSHH